MEEIDKPQQKTDSKKRKRALFVSSVVGAVIILGAVAISTRSSNTNTPTSNLVLTQNELASYNGKSGAKCYVAIEKTVYEIKQGKKWKDGEHTTSNGQAYCGRDLSEVISNSPHGKSILDILSPVGTLQ